MPPIPEVSRRDFLRTGGAVVVSFALDSVLAKWSSAQSPAVGAEFGKPLDPHQVDSFLAFHSDGSVTIYTSKVDVGTGLRTAMSQMTAEELGIPFDRVSVVEGDTALTPDHGGTGGSSGIPRGAVDVRQAAATARQAILNLGAEALKRPAAELILDGGSVRPSAGGTGVSIAKLIGGKRLSLPVDPKATLRAPASYTIVGKPILRPDVSGKCTGQRVYVQDFTVPNMLHGRVIRPPAIGSKLVSDARYSRRACDPNRKFSWGGRKRRMGSGACRAGAQSHLDGMERTPWQRTIGRTRARKRPRTR
jgi:nicotinate dehydrogenase subunit B